MPTGTYRVMDGTGRQVGTEEFRTARGPAGWRYVATIRTEEPEPHTEALDVIVGGDGRIAHTRIETGSHEIELSTEGGRMTGTLDGEPLEVSWGDASHLDYLSPCFNAITANLLDGTTELEVVYLAPVTCRPRIEPQRYESLGEQRVDTPVGAFEANAWRYTALSSGWSRPLWVAGDVVVAYEDLFELAAYDPGRTGPHPL